jgi:hypothetical protein
LQPEVEVIRKKEGLSSATKRILNLSVEFYVSKYFSKMLQRFDVLQKTSVTDAKQVKLLAVKKAILEPVFIKKTTTKTPMPAVKTVLSLSPSKSL